MRGLSNLEEKMNQRVDAFLIHGIGKTIEGNYYDNFVDAIRRKLPIDADVNFHPVNYSEPLDKREGVIWKWMEGMAYQKLRNFGCFFIADILAYAPPEHPPKPGDFYYDVNKILSDKFADVEATYPNSKKVIIAHSLGTQIAFSFAWGHKIEHLFCMGSPILYFSVRFKDFGMFPVETLKGMTNFWNTNDPIATRIERNPNLKVCKDIRVRSFNPRYLLPLQAHSMYFTSNDVHQKIADVIKKM